ncbi:MAG: alpha/beta hydrolase [Clostridia bacterium]|nr:alpha/beta hydrolase [Clostridia bacterium]
MLTGKSVLLGNDENIHYIDVGQGEKVLVLIHGNMNSSANWDLLIEAMDPDQYRMIAVDLRGMGHSSYIQPVASIKDFSDDLDLLFKRLGLEKFSLIGWSAGGAVVLQYAADYPEKVEKLVLLEGASIKGFPIPKKTLFGKIKPGQYVSSREEIAKKVKLVERAYEKKNKKFLKMILNKALYTVKKCPMDKIEYYIDEMMLQRNLVDLNYSLVHFNISHEHNGVVEGNGLVDKIVAPTLVIQGELDKLVTMAMAKSNVEAIQNAELAVLSACGHVPLVDDMNSLKATLVNFLES